MNITKRLIIPDRNNMEESIRIAQEYKCGYEYQDFFLPEVLEDEELQENLIENYKKQEFQPAVSTLHGAFFDVIIFSEDRRIFEVSDLRVEQSLRAAEQLGVQGVVFHTNYTPNFSSKGYREDWVERNVSYWESKLKRYPKLHIYMENMFDTDCELLVKLARRMENQPRFGICLDYAHACVFGKAMTMEKWIEELAPYVKHIHINDNDGTEDLHWALGEGRMNWSQFKTDYEKYFMDTTVLIEVFGNDKIEKSLKWLNEL